MDVVAIGKLEFPIGVFSLLLFSLAYKPYRILLTLSPALSYPSPGENAVIVFS